MAKNGQSRVLTAEQQRYLFQVINDHRFPAKNTAIMKISFNLGLRVQEIALLQIKEICRLAPYRKSTTREFKLLDILTLPAAYTKGADALQRSSSKYTPTTLNFKVDDFDKVIKQVEALAKAGGVVDPTDYYPTPRKHKHKGKSRDLPMIDDALRESLIEYLKVRLEKNPNLKLNDPLFVTQKGGAYSPNTLQEHMALMLRGWAGIEKASSHSGRRTLITDVIHKQNKSVKIAQKIAGHKQASTTILYEEPPEEEISAALRGISG
jgi:integrase